MFMLLESSESAILGKEAQVADYKQLSRAVEMSL